MAVRKIVHIEEDKCNGCGLCVPSCAEGAIQIINGKAKLVKDQYCDGLGACLGECPQDAIRIIERNAEEFDEEAALEHVKTLKKSSDKSHLHQHQSGGCPGSKIRTFLDEPQSKSEIEENETTTTLKSQLRQWPIQISLVPIKAPFFENSNLMITADCVPFAYAEYHPKLLKGKVVLIGCPKLDDVEFYADKLTQIVSSNNIASITVAYMEVPCCRGIVSAIETAIKNSGKVVSLEKVCISIDGNRL